MLSAKKLFFTTILLTLTSFLMKTVGVWFNVYLTDLVGTVGMGIFQLVMTVYALSKTLAYGGMNLAATRLCIDDFAHARHSMKRLLFTSLCLGLFAAALLYLLSDFLSLRWILTEKAAPSLRILSASLPFVALSAALNGYMTAARKMTRYSLIQLAEQIAKIFFCVFITTKFPGGQSEASIAKVSLAITLSEIVSFSLCMRSYRYDIKKHKMQKSGKKGFLRRMARLAVPDALGAYVRSALNTIEHLLIPIGIRKSGQSAEKAFSDYGAVQGMALPIVLYPSSILGVLSGLLVPEIAECKLKKNEVQSNYMINRVLHIALVFSMICASAMFVFADELSEVIYKRPDAANFIRILSPLVPIMYLDMTTDGMLKGLDRQMDIMKINVLDSVLCVVLVWILVPKIAVDGYIITIYAAEIINFILSFSKLSKCAKLRFSLRKNCLLPLVCSLLCCQFAKNILPSLSPGSITTSLAIFFSLVIYLVLLRLFGGITKEDLVWFSALLFPKKKKNRLG